MQAYCRQVLAWKTKRRQSFGCCSFCHELSLWKHVLSWLSERKERDIISQAAESSYDNVWLTLLAWHMQHIQQVLWLQLESVSKNLLTLVLQLPKPAWLGFEWKPQDLWHHLLLELQYLSFWKSHKSNGSELKMFWIRFDRSHPDPTSYMFPEWTSQYDVNKVWCISGQHAGCLFKLVLA